jgi:hypothetical protein
MVTADARYSRRFKLRFPQSLVGISKRQAKPEFRDRPPSPCLHASALKNRLGAR